MCVTLGGVKAHWGPCFSRVSFFFACSKIWLGHARRVERARRLSGPWWSLGLDLPVRFSTKRSWMRVEQRRPVSFCGQLRRVQRQLGGWAHCMEAQWLAVGAWFVATNPAPNDVEDAWLLCVEAIHPGPRLTFDVVRLSYLEQVLCRIRCGVVLQSLFRSRSGVERSCPDPKIPS